MSVEVKGLADTIRRAKAAIGKASSAAKRMDDSASRLTDTLPQVEELTSQLDAATSELQGAIAGLTNGGPPLEPSTSGSDVTRKLSVPGSLEIVQGVKK